MISPAVSARAAGQIKKISANVANKVFRFVEEFMGFSPGEDLITKDKTNRIPSYRGDEEKCKNFYIRIMRESLERFPGSAI